MDVFLTPFRTLRLSSVPYGWKGPLFAAKIIPLTISLERQNQASPVVRISRRDNRSPTMRADVDSAL